MNLDQTVSASTSSVCALRSVRLMTTAPVTTVDADVAVVGSGFAGSLIALALRKRNRRVVLVERGRHPRFVIGESSTPLANLLIEELADRYDLPRIRAFSKWGTWQKTHPGVGVGLKRGFTFYFHRLDEPFEDDDAARPAAAGCGEPARRDRGHALVSARLRPRAGSRSRSGGRDLPGRDTPRTASVRRAIGRRSRARARAVPSGSRRGFVVDATGPRGFLHDTLRLEDAPCRWLPPTQGLFTHFADVEPMGSVDAVVRRAAVSG